MSSAQPNHDTFRCSLSLRPASDMRRGLGCQGSKWQLASRGFPSSPGVTVHTGRSYLPWLKVLMSQKVLDRRHLNCYTLQRYLFLEPEGHSQAWGVGYSTASFPGCLCDGVLGQA